MTDELSRRVWGRRAFCSSGLAAIAAGLAACRLSSDARAADASAASNGSPEEVTIVEFSDAGVRGSTVERSKVDAKKTAADWRRQLSTSLQFDVTRKAGTERAFTGVTWNEHGGGTLSLHLLRQRAVQLGDEVRVRNGLAKLLAAAGQRESSSRPPTPPSAWSRIEVSCRLCDAHLGHVFDDRAETNRASLLHELGGDEVCRQTRLIPGSGPSRDVWDWRVSPAGSVGHLGAPSRH